MVLRASLCRWTVIAYGAIAVWIALPAQAADYWWVSNGAKLATYIDKERVRPTTSGKIAWVLEINTDVKLQSSTFVYSLELSEYGCENRTIKKLSFVDYKRDGTVIDSETVSYPTEDIVVPESIGESEFNFVCGIGIQKDQFIEIGNVSIETIVDDTAPKPSSPRRR